jgi:general secretion pathway protein N
VTAKPAEAPTVAANPLWAIPLSALTATRARPLFTPSRRPPAPVVASVPVAAPRPLPAPPPAVPQHPNLTLVGTVAGENEGVAVFIDTATRDTVRLRTGEGHSGWILQSVERRSATLQKGDQTEKLALPRPNEQEKSAPVVSTLPPPPSPPPPPSGASAPAKAPQSGGCMPEPVGC